MAGVSGLLYIMIHDRFPFLFSRWAAIRLYAAALSASSGLGVYTLTIRCQAWHHSVVYGDGSPLYFVCCCLGTLLPPLILIYHATAGVHDLKDMVVRQLMRCHDIADCFNFGVGHVLYRLGESVAVLPPADDVAVCCLRLLHC